jgi:hypothetical protein
MAPLDALGADGLVVAWQAAGRSVGRATASSMGALARGSAGATNLGIPFGRTGINAARTASVAAADLAGAGRTIVGASLPQSEAAAMVEVAGELRFPSSGLNLVGTLTMSVLPWGNTIANGWEALQACTR